MKIWKNTSTLDRWLGSYQLTQQPEEATLAILGSKSIDLVNFPKLKALFKCGVGVDNVPFKACEEREIAIGLPTPETADFIYDETAAFTVSLIYRMLYADIGDVDSWEKRSRRSMKEKQLLVIGTGNIGQRVINLLEGHIQIDTYDQLHNSPSELLDKLRQADAVTLHLPLNDSTRGLLAREELRLLKDGCLLINTARGPLVDESALLREIQDNRLRAAFDVFWQEPYSGPLKGYHPHRFYMTPHVASNNQRFLESLAGDFKAFVSRFEQ